MTQDEAVPIEAFASAMGTSARNVRYLVTEKVLPDPLEFHGRILFGAAHRTAYAAYAALYAKGLSARQVGAIAQLPPDEIEALVETIRSFAGVRRAAEKETVPS